MRRCSALLVFAACAARADIVTNTAASGPGSLRRVFDDHLEFVTGPITFAPELSGQTIAGSGEFNLGGTFIPPNPPRPVNASSVVIDASNLPGGITISGGGRIFRVPLGKSLTLKNVTLTGASDSGEGGAVSSYGSVQLTGCTFTGNSGAAVGVMTAQTAGITRCTFTGNGSAVSCQAYGSATLTHCTVSGNGTGLSIGYRYPGITVINCIVAGNTLDVFNMSNFTRQGANIIQTLTNAGSDPYPGHDGGSPAITAAPLLAPLGNYGGPTQTMALLPGSPARNAAAGSFATSDQRGFPIVGIPDLGAYEAGNGANYNGWTFETLPAGASAAQRAAGFDFDGDGQSNSDEFNFLTNPASGASLFAPLSVREGGSLRISFTSAPGRSYSLQQNNTLSPAAWAGAPGLSPVSGDGSVKSFLIPTGALRQFFRVQGAVGP